MEVTPASVGRRLKRWESFPCPPSHLNIMQKADNCLISGEMVTFRHGGSIQIGNWVFIGTGTRLWSAERIELGDRVLVSHNVDIHDSDSHPANSTARFEQTKAILTTGHPPVNPGIIAAPVRIEDDAWIGFGASILKGVTIARGAIVGARSVITKDVPPYTVVVGNPAKIVRELRPDERLSPQLKHQSQN